MVDQLNNPEYVPPYEGNDMTGYIMSKGFALHDKSESIQSITNVRDTAIIVTDHSVWRARPCHQIGFCIELMTRI